MDACTARNDEAHVAGISRAGLVRRVKFVPLACASATLSLTSCCILALQECSKARHKIEAASVSSASCASNGNLSLSRSSSDCRSLNCPELNVEGMNFDAESAGMEKTAELPGSHGDAARLACTSPAQYNHAGDIYQVLRDDLQKQEEALLQCAAAALSSCGCPQNCYVPAVPCRLPAAHRTLLVGWMREVTGALRLHLTTLFTATHLLDRYLAAVQMLPPDKMLQLLALTCMSVAVKYNEVTRVTPQIWLSLAVDAAGQHLYQPSDLQRFEWLVLQTIGWRLHQPTTLTFLQHYMSCLAAKAGDDDSTGRLGPASAPWFPAQVINSSWQPATQVQHMWPGARAADDATAGLNASLIRWPVIKEAMALAELTLSSDAFLPYSYSTVALACLILSTLSTAPRASVPASTVSFSVVPGGGIAMRPPSILPVGNAPKPSVLIAASVSAAVSGCCGVSLDRLAPGLMSCVVALEKCHHAACLVKAR